MNCLAFLDDCLFASASDDCLCKVRVCLSPSVRPIPCLSVCPFVYWSVCLSVCLSMFLSVCVAFLDENLFASASDDCLCKVQSPSVDNFNFAHCCAFIELSVCVALYLLFELARLVLLLGLGHTRVFEYFRRHVSGSPPYTTLSSRYGFAVCYSEATLFWL